MAVTLLWWSEVNVHVRAIVKSYRQLPQLQPPFRNPELEVLRGERWGLRLEMVGVVRPERNHHRTRPRNTPHSAFLDSGAGLMG